MTIQQNFFSDPKQFLENNNFDLIIPKTQQEIEELQQFANKQLRRIRQGWLNRGITEQDNGETIYEHQVRLSENVRFYCANVDKNQTKIYTNNQINYHNIMVMAKFHDMAEALVPDFTPHDNISPKDKHELEKKSIQILKLLVDPITAKFMEQSFLEYDAKQTLESKLLTQLDKYCVVPESLTHEDKFPKVENMYEYARNKISCPILIQTHEILMSRELKGACDQSDLYNSLLLTGADLPQIKQNLIQAKTQNRNLLEVTIQNDLKTNGLDSWERRQLFKTYLPTFR
jgi:5'-deoxynucleotidase YfbR-like HD superfamily hydrolase